MVTRIYSAFRPTGRMHLGNYFGALQNMIQLQDQYECIFGVADIHALTTIEGKETARINEHTLEMVTDWLAAGLDPERCIIYRQSQVKEELALHTLLSMVTPLGWLLRVPTFKEKVRSLNRTEENVSYGLVGYPVQQTADVILFKAEGVPVGKDQAAHIELCREIARRFNHLYGETFPEPQAIYTETPFVVGTDGNKMGKSTNNGIELNATEDQTSQKVMSMITDPQRARREDPGRPEVCNVYALQALFNPEGLDEIYTQCTNATIGCVEDKRNLAESMNEFFREFRERRRTLESDPERVRKILEDGAGKARVIAAKTLDEVYMRMGLV